MCDRWHRLPRGALSRMSKSTERSICVTIVWLVVVVVIGFYCCFVLHCSGGVADECRSLNVSSAVCGICVASACICVLMAL